MSKGTGSFGDDLYSIASEVLRLAAATVIVAVVGVWVLRWMDVL